MPGQSSGDGKKKQSAEHKTRPQAASQSDKTARRRSSRSGKPADRHRSQQQRRRQSGADDEDQYAEFMQNYGSQTDIRLAVKTKPARRDETAAPKRRRIARTVQVSTGLIIQGVSLTASIVLPGLIITLWTFGYLESAAAPLGWTIVALGGAGAIAGEVMCLAVPAESGTRQLARAAFALTCLMLAGLGLDALLSQQGPVFRIILDVTNLLLIMARMCLVTLFLSRLAGYVEEPTYETRSIFAMVGMPLAMAATFGYLQFVPAATEDSAFSLKAVSSGIQWWIIATTVAVTVMYISILLGLGLALRRHRRDTDCTTDR